MSEAEVGGDPPCWAHLFDESADPDVAGELDDQRDQAPTNAPTDDGGFSVVDLASASADSGGAIWSLPHGGDLDANLVRLSAGEGIEAHVNNDVDVLVLVQDGSVELVVDGRFSALGTDHLALIPKGAKRAITAGINGVTYLSIHRCRSPLGITRRAK